ncbi:MAG: PAS domain S-box protein [Euryarchaeota archaeon]|nr:PAS domain S-box protein [Euryarchaeota archaeon]
MSRSNKESLIESHQNPIIRKTTPLQNIPLDIKENAIASSINGMAFTDLDGNITYVNQSFLNLWGYRTDDEILGKPLVKFWQKKGKTADTIDTVMKKGGWMGELIAEKKNGEPLSVEISFSLVQDKNRMPLCLMASLVDITKQKKATEEILYTKNFLQNIINSASEVIISFDKQNIITAWNKTAEYITGYNDHEMLGKNILTVSLFEDQVDLQECIHNITEGRPWKLDDLVIRTKHGSTKVLKPSCSIIQTGTDRLAGILLIARDITYELGLQGKLVNGGSYLLAAKETTDSNDFFNDLMKSGYLGLYITRGNPEKLRNVFSENVSIMVLNPSPLEEFRNIVTLEDLTTAVRKFSKNQIKSIIYIDRIDYLISCFTFEKFVETLYRLTSITAQNNALLLIGVNPDLLDARQLAFLKAELSELPHQEIIDMDIDEDAFSILQFIFDQNQRNLLIPFKKISKQFSIVKSTTAKRLRSLQDKELIFIKKQGRLKIVSITDRGKTFVTKRCVT